MADAKALAALKSGSEAWNQYLIRLSGNLPDRPFDFTDANLREVKFYKLDFPIRAQFDGSHFKDAHFKGTRFGQGASFVGARFEGTTIIEANKGLVDLSFDQARFEGPVKVKSLESFKTVRFVGAQFLEGFIARGTDDEHRLTLPHLSFQQAAVSGNLTFEYCNFRLVDFSLSRLALPLDGMQENLCYASFRNCVFRSGARFEGTEFAHGANFENAKFHASSSFRGAAFAQAPNFHDAVLHQGTPVLPQKRFSSAVSRHD
jgi:uncharacterized protein YjbI with pentapeptide repeats